MTIRTTKRQEAMRRVQAAALDLFDERGFSQATIEEIAARAGTSPATVYRHFGTKEDLVLWDEYDPVLLDGVAAALREHRPIAAVQAALIASLDRVYAADRARILRRARHIVEQPTLMARTAADQQALRRALARVFVRARAVRGALAADVLAGAVVAALAAAVEHWVAAGGRVALARFLSRAFTTLAPLDTAGASDAPLRSRR